MKKKKGSQPGRCSCAFGIVWRHSWLSQLGGRSWHLLCVDQRCCLISCSPIPAHDERGLGPGVRSGETEKRWVRHALCCASLLSHCLTVCNPVNCSPPGSMGILQAGILQRVAKPSSRGSSQHRDQTQIFRIAGGFFTV